jgi:quercetin dioxygenase-like cupin family protein
MNDSSDQNRNQRQIIKTAKAKFGAYDFEGPVQEDMGLLKLSYQKKSGQGAYLMRMEPGAETVRHVHNRREEYLILQGDLVESDGTVLETGDYVIYQPGTEHNSRTVNGCMLFGIDYDFV